uniref:cohesin subunit SA-2-like isoform X1 n=1 Tax=Styela clava TaxID=7725 RepID=UPI0019393E8E|nr:cohesin subunit SA-2-like isoform X1 [Styela clava]
MGGGDESGSGSDSELEEEDQVVRGGGRKRGRGGGRAMQAQKRSKQDSDVPATLFEVVRQGKMAMTAVVDDWIEAYKADRNEALLDLIQFFINASGCKGTVTPEMLREASEGFQDVIKRMTEEFDEDSGDYPLIASGPNFKKFRSNFSDFVQALVRQCQYQIIYDQFMMDNVLTLLTELSNSQVRAFRHTSTLAAMKLMTALVNVALQLSVSLDNTQRQYEGERAKSANKRASEKLDMLLEKRKDLEDQQTEIESMLNGIFKGIFVHRYRDFIADIRALCMEEIGVWMKMFPKVFLTDSYLKYVGWTLHDKQKEVRMKCLMTLQGLYRDDEMTKDLKLFTSRFKDRIVSMTLDKEYDVAVLAIKLLILILDHCGYDTPVLSSNDSESVYQLVYSVHRPVAIAAAEFLNKQLFANKEVTPGYTKRGRRRSPNAPLITDLVLFFIESELHEHATYLVDSLWDVASNMLKDWDCMSDLLLEEPANDRDQMDSRQESALVDIMVCSVKQAAEGTPPTGRQGFSKKLATRDKRTALEDKVRLTELFIVALPSLLNKYQVDKEKVTMLLQIPRFFDLELYTTSRLEKHLEMLLRQMSTIIDKHTDADLLEQASMTYHKLCDNDYTMCNKAQVERQTVIDTWAENFTLALDIFKDATSDSTNGADEEEIYNVVQALKRLTQIYMHNNILSCELHPSVSSILQMYQEKPDSVPEDMLEQAIKFLHCDLMYNLAVVKHQEDGGQSATQDQKLAIAKLRQKVTEFLQSCQELLSQSPHPKVKEASYMALCDLIVLFSPQLAHSCPNLRPLVQRPSDTVQHLLIDFVNTYVFIVHEDDDDDEEDTAKIDALHHRRLLLAAICKLFVFNMIELRLAASVFQQYIRFYPDYGDIIKETISRARHANKMACAHTLALSIMSLYRETIRMQGGSLDQSSQEYGHLKELARRLSLTFGLDQVKTRDAVAALHKEGILFALKKSDDHYNENYPPENLSFLLILVEFSSKLMRQDRKTVVNYLDKHIKPHMLKQQTAGWIPLVTYRNSLIQGSDDAEIMKQPMKGRRGRKKKNVDGDVDAPRTPMTPATPMSPGAPMTPMNPVPQHTSTVQRDGVPPKQMRMDDANVSSISYQQHGNQRDLKSWLDSGKEGRRLRQRRDKNKVSVSEEDTTPKRGGKTSMLASIFDSESQESSDIGDVSEIRKKLRKVQVEDVSERSVRDEDVIEEVSVSGSNTDEGKKTSTHPIRKRKKTGIEIISDEIDEFGNKNGALTTNTLESSAGRKGTRRIKERNADKIPNKAMDSDVSGRIIKKKNENLKPRKSVVTDAESMDENDESDFKDAVESFSPEKIAKKASRVLKKGKNIDMESPAQRRSSRKNRKVFSYNEESPEIESSPKKLLRESKQEIQEGGKRTRDARSNRLSEFEQEKSSPAHVSYFKNIQSNPNVTIDDVNVEEELFGFWDEIERKENDRKDEDTSLSSEESSFEMENADISKKFTDDTTKNEPKETTKIAKIRPDLKNFAKQSVATTPSISQGSQLSEKEKAEFEKSEKFDQLSGTQSKMEEDGFLSADDTTFISEDEVFKDARSQKSSLKSPAKVVTTQDVFTSANPFAKFTKNLRGTKLIGKIQSEDEEDFMSEESLSDENAPLSPLTQRSGATVRTHISDVDVVDLLLDENDSKNQDEMFGAFANVVRDVHSQSSQNIDLLSGGTTQRSKFTDNADFDLDSLFNSGDEGSESEMDNPFAAALKKAKSSSRHLTSPMSPMSSDCDEDNFATMFGFGKTKKKTKVLRQPNLMGSTMMTSPGHSMTSPVHQGTPDYHQQMRQGGGGYQQIQQQQQQFVVPGQQMMYQQQGYQMMQSPGHMQQQSGMPGQSFYGS